MKRAFPATLLLLAHAFLWTASGRGQTFYFADGRSMVVESPKVTDGDLVIPLRTGGGGAGSAEIRRPLSTIVRVDWPVPDAVAEAEKAAKTGASAGLLEKIDPLLLLQEPFRDVPGSWWSRAASLKAVVLAGLGKKAEARAMIGRMRDAKSREEDIVPAEVALAGAMADSGEADEALARLDALQKDALLDSSLASIAVARGRAWEKKGRFEDALLSYLRVSVFYPDEKEAVPAALEGTARAYEKMGDSVRAALAQDALAALKPKPAEEAPEPPKAAKRPKAPKPAEAEAAPDES